MFKIVYKNIESSAFVTELTRQKIESVLEKFSIIKDHQVISTIFVENSSDQKGPDLFGIKISISGHKFKNILIEKKAITFYLALAEVQEALLERLNRFNDKKRVIKEKKGRLFKRIYRELLPN